ncbi:MAG TPA: hypothetical protein VGJ74_07295 [Burkholderiales bacterium]
MLQPVSRETWRQLGMCEICVLLDLLELRRDIDLLVQHIFPPRLSIAKPQARILDAGMRAQSCNE